MKLYKFNVVFTQSFCGIYNLQSLVMMRIVVFTHIYSLAERLLHDALEAKRLVAGVTLAGGAEW